MFEHTIFGLAPLIDAKDTASDPPTGTPVRRDAATMRLLPGAVVPGTRYRLLNWLGDGGMGVVYEAEHIDLERRVALKILRSQIAEREEECERFRQEARLTTRIISPHVVQVLDFGVLDDGRVFYTMELLDGQPLSAEIARGPIAPARVIGLLRQMCAGLAAAHRAGVIHRDVKPENTIVVKDRSGRACIKLLDFGIASHVSDADSRRASGTPEYMAPEQIEGKPFDLRLDIYALGCTAYEMLVGHPPFPRESTVEIVRAHLEELPMPPNRLVEQPTLEIPQALEQVVLRCLAKHPDDRYASMADLEAALCEAQIAAGLRTEWDDLPLPDVSPARREKLEARMPRPRPSWAVRRRRWVMVATAATAALTFALWFSSANVVAADHERIEQLVATARDAAARGAYVYPAQGEKTETAYGTLVTLEQLEGPTAPLADEAADQLRRVLADELVGLGDGYWDDPDSRPYARDYYAQAVLFDPRSDHARTRAGFTPGELTELRARAEAQDFTEPELAAIEPLVALAVVDESERAQKISEVAAADPTSLSSRRRIDALARKNPRAEPERKAEPSAVRPGARSGGDAAPRTVSWLDKLSARQLARHGQRALAAGDRDSALAAFERAVALDPNNGLAHLGLGDAQRKHGEREAARSSYQRAHALGRREARERLDGLRRMAKR